MADDEDLFSAIGVDVEPETGRLSLKKPGPEPEVKPHVILPTDLKEVAEKVLEGMREPMHVKVTKIVLIGDRGRRTQLEPGMRLLVFHEPRG